MYTVLFVCTGNTCRSPMAECLLMQMAGQEGLGQDVRVCSAGVSAAKGAPLSEGAARALQKRGVSGFESHRSRPLDLEDVRAADLILTMAESHKETLIHHFPEAVDKVYTLREYASLDEGMGEGFEEWRRLAVEDRLEQAHGKSSRFDIEDPFGASDREYDVTAEQIESALKRVLPRIRSQLGR